MERQKRFAVIGSDARQLAAGRALARAGYAVEGPEEIALADYILLPLPLDAARTPLAELLRAARPGALALGGMLSEEAKAIAAEAGVELVDSPRRRGASAFCWPSANALCGAARSCCWDLARWGRRLAPGWRHWGPM